MMPIAKQFWTITNIEQKLSLPNNNIKVNQAEFLDKNIHAKVLGNQITNQKKKRKDNEKLRTMNL